MRAAGEVVAEGPGEEAAELGSGEGSGYGAIAPQTRPPKSEVWGEAEGCSRESAHDDAGDELRRNEPAGGGGALVVEDLAEGKEAEDADGDWGAEEGERGCR